MKEALIVATLALLDGVNTLQSTHERKVLKKPPINWTAGDRGRVLMIHGWRLSWTSMTTIGEYINQLGFQVFPMPDLGDNTQPLTKSVRVVSDQIMLMENPVSLLGFSWGGDILRKVIRDPQVKPKIDKAITIATPHEGTFWGIFNLLGSRDLSPYSDVFRRQIPSGKEDGIIDNLYPYKDLLVIPNSSLILEGARSNHPIGVVGHREMLVSKETLEELKTILIHA